MNHKQLGAKGEELAIGLLKSKAHRILDVNYRWNRGELDIISLNNDRLVITEVKTRNSTALGSPVLSISKKKQNQIIKISNQYAISHGRTEEIRFDVILIILNSKGVNFNHIQDAFYPIV